MNHFENPRPTPSIEAPKKTERLFRPEQIQNIIKEREAEFRKLVVEAYTKNGTSDSEIGQDDTWQATSNSDLKYRVKQPYRQGKQQLVIIIECATPQGVFEMVCKRDGRGMYKLQNEEPLFQRLLPRIYFEEQGVAVIEKVEGLELERYQEYIKEEKHLQELVETAVAILEDVSQTSFSLDDVSFVIGHNVMFDTQQKRFRLFDIHSFSEDTSTVPEKMCRFINRVVGGGNISPEGARFVGLFLQRYLERHPEQQEMEYEGEVKRSLQDGTEEYEQNWKRIIEKNPRLKRTGWRGSIVTLDEGVIGIREDVRKACQENRIEDVFKLLQDPRYKDTQNPILECKRKL